MSTHIYLVLDESESMARLAAAANRVAQSWLTAMADGDTRVSVAYFSYKTRWVLNGAAGSGFIVEPIRPNGMTALRDAVHEAVQRAQVQLNADPDASALILAVTDGMENQSRRTPGELQAAVTHLRQSGRADIGLLVPPGTREEARRQVGLGTEDVREWEVSERGLAAAEDLVRRSYGAYKSARAAGTRSVGRFFVDASTAGGAEVKRAGATPLPLTRIREFPVPAKARIDEFATSRTGNYVVGEWYYQLTKPETIQGHKRMLLDDNGVWYEGDGVRAALGLGGSVGDVRVAPVGLGRGRRVFVQSTATNRNLIPGQAVVRLGAP